VSSTGCVVVLGLVPMPLPGIIWHLNPAAFISQGEMKQRLLRRIARSFPLSPAPFKELGDEIGVGERECLTMITDLAQQGIIREIAPIFYAPALGYRTTLVALKVAWERLERAAQIVNRHPGVSHNYSREGEYNLWFTLCLPEDSDFGTEITALGENAAAEDILPLPAIKGFKLSSPYNEVTPLPSLVPQPFYLLASEFDVHRLLHIAQQLLAGGIMRRYAARLNHFKVGLPVGALGCWQVAEEEVEKAAQTLATLSQVSHCYQRVAYPHWKYNLYAMFHGKTRKEVESLASRVGLRPFTLLFTVKEYKKERVRYFQ